MIISLATRKFVNEHFLFSLDLCQTLQLDCVSLKLGFLLIEILVQFHHLPLPILSLALPFVPFPQSPQLLFFNFNSEVVQAFSQ